MSHQFKEATGKTDMQKSEKAGCVMVSGVCFGVTLAKTINEILAIAASTPNDIRIYQRPGQFNRCFSHTNF